jgi:hypothetical protein
VPSKLVVVSVVGYSAGCSMAALIPFGCHLRLYKQNWSSLLEANMTLCRAIKGKCSPKLVISSPEADPSNQVHPHFHLVVCGSRKKLACFVYLYLCHTE